MHRGIFVFLLIYYYWYKVNGIHKHIMTERFFLHLCHTVLVIVYRERKLCDGHQDVSQT